MPNGWKTIYVSFTGPITSKPVEQLQAFLAEQTTKGVQSFYLLLSSLGGGVKEGITLYNFIKSLPAEVVVHNIGRVNSVANVVFAAGAKRLAVPHSSFMFHGVGFDITQPARFEEKEIRQRLDSIVSDQKDIASILQAEMGLPVERTQSMFLETAVIDAYQAKELGIVHAIGPADVPKGAPLMQLVSGF